MFTASRLQAATYLLAVCLFSISFLVFLNSSVSFVVTDLIKQRHGVGDAVGTLGFADELVALVACPAWGILSDRVGVRAICVLGYAIVGVALCLFVQARNVYPQLLLARLFFGLGGAATSTMVTAILPSMTAVSKSKADSGSATCNTQTSTGHAASPSISSELTVTPMRLRACKPPSESASEATLSKSSPTRLAGFVGMFTGCGALVALGLFLPLPARFQEAGLEPGKAVAASYYIVGGIAVAVSSVCFVGLRHLNGEEGKGWHALLGRKKSDQMVQRSPSDLPYWRLFVDSLKMGYRSPLLGLGYLGGFVARASSVGISLFIPLYVNAYFISSELCQKDPDGGHDAIKEQCRRAYVLAAELTGVSQLVALLFAPIFGYLADRYRQYNLPLLTAALAGVLGYIVFALMKSPDPSGEHGSPWIFVVVALLGISQIGSIVCSLGLLGRGILGLEENNSQDASAESIRETLDNANNYGSGNGVTVLPATSRSSIEDLAFEDENTNGEERELLSNTLPRNRSLNHLKGSIAGVYSLAGGAGILLLTKLGGSLFDSLSPTAPFYMLSLFNGLLLFVGILCGILTGPKN
ncbi:MAG: MFS general substrate transporter [Lasallia pustulata]|uniref:MFS general substrate transporter n=2 Tax=Lasallia pustulata TaxID=136370 RepID=A0A5M8Q2C9_9LECA|nr:MAG: MFS general substrate transporter [Lasallia pustulata]